MLHQHQQHSKQPALVAWLCVLAFFSVLNETIFNVSLPDLAASFAKAPAQINWVNSGFLLTFALGSVLYSKMSDRYGIRQPLLAGLVLYSVGSLLGVLGHTSFACVIAARLIQGAGISAVPALLVMLVVRYTEPSRQGKAFGLIGSIVAAGESIGPVAGGLLTQYVHWYALFLLPMVTLLALPALLHALPKETRQQQPIDWAGALLFSTTIVFFTLWMTTYRMEWMIASLLLALLTGWRLQRAPVPFLAPALFRNRPFVAGVLGGSLLLGTVAGFIALVPYLMRHVYQFTTSATGATVLFPGTVGVILFGYIGGILVDRYGHRLAFLSGLLLVSGSLLGTALLPAYNRWLVTGAVVIAFGGLAFLKTVISYTVSRSLDQEQAGAGMGLLNFACFLGEGLGVAFVGGLLSMPAWNEPLLPLVPAQAASYSNALLALLAIVAIGALLVRYCASRAVQR